MLGYNMFAYCGNNPVCNIDASGMRYCAGTTVSNESEEERGISCRWQKYIKIEDPTILDKWEVSGVRFVPNKSGDGGKLLNSYLITDKNEMTSYAMYLMNESRYSSFLSGSVEGFVFEWDFHNKAHSVFKILNNETRVTQAKDLDVGRTIYADSHGQLSTAMFYAFELCYPEFAKLDRQLYISIYGQ